MADSRLSSRADPIAPLFWLLFAGGGTVSAMVLPALAFLTGIAVPAGWLSEDDLLTLIRNPWTRLILVGLVFLFLFHWAHRFRYALVDLGFGRFGKQAWLFYAAAGAGTALAGVAAITM